MYYGISYYLLVNISDYNYVIHFKTKIVFGFSVVFVVSILFCRCDFLLDCIVQNKITRTKYNSSRTQKKNSLD